MPAAAAETIAVQEKVASSDKQRQELNDGQSPLITQRSQVQILSALHM
jgi:hypothetical protein